MRFGLIIPLVALMTSCREKEAIVENTTNNPPVADAGPDQSLSADQEIRLDGGGSFDPDGDAMSYTWAFSRVPDGSILLEEEEAFTTNNLASSITNFIPDMMGTYIISLVVTDTKGVQSLSDSVIISVSEGTLPTAMAGPDQNTTEGEVVLLDGSASFDSLNRALSYDWSISSAPQGSTSSIVDTSSVASTFTPDVSGNYLVSLVVSSGGNASNPDVLVVKVGSSNPEAPTAVISASGTVLEDCTDLQLDGSASSDPNGDALSYFWSLQEKPTTSTSSNDSFSDRSAVQPTFYTDVAGDYVVSLAVNDGADWSAPELLTLAVTERIANSVPAVNAGNSLTIDGGDAECEPSGYSYSCNSCEDMIVTLGQGGSVNDPDGDTYSLAWSVLDGDASISDESSINTSITLRNAEPEEPGMCTNTVYEVLLSATDCPGMTGSDSVTFTVTCCGIEATAQ
jgi:hypothetical protein